MASKEFTMQVRVTTDDEAVFASVQKLLCKQCRELFAVLTVAAGSSSQKPDIRLLSDDFIMGEKEIMNTSAGIGMEPDTSEGNEDPDDRVL